MICREKLMETFKSFRKIFEPTKQKIWTDQSESALFSVPKDILGEIISYLEGNEVVTLSFTCRRSRHFIESNTNIWRNLCEKKYLIFDFGLVRDWKDYYFSKDKTYSDLATINVVNQYLHNSTVNNLVTKLASETQFKSIGTFNTSLFSHHSEKQFIEKHLANFVKQVFSLSRDEATQLQEKLTSELLEINRNGSSSNRDSYILLWKVIS